MSSLLETKLEALRVNEERIKEERRVLHEEIDEEKNREKRKCGIATLEARMDSGKKYLTSFNRDRLKYQGVKEEYIRISSSTSLLEIILDIFHHQEERRKN